MRKHYATGLLVALLVSSYPQSAAAHGFGQLYNLPVPLWLYGWGAAATLLLSFVAAAWLLNAPATVAMPATRDLTGSGFARVLRLMKLPLQLFGVAVLLLCITSGLLGNRDPQRNFNMTFFWIVFLLGFSYLSALLGNFYAAVNPWQVLANIVGRFWRGYSQGRVRYPNGLGYWPALVLYLGLCSYELFGHSTPKSLAWMLLIYSGVNLLGVGLIGRAAWFRHCEVFAVFLRLLSQLAPLQYVPAQIGERSRLSWRWPLAGLLQQRPEHLSSVVFILAMLSSTAFDGLRATQWWVGLFWKDPSGIVAALAGTRPILAYAQLRPWYIAWESVCLWLAPLIYFAAYIASLWLAKTLTRSSRPLRELALDFAYSLLPIVLVYHLTHYVSLLLGQGMKILSLISDPFGWGWNLFGSAWHFRQPILPSMALLWHSQVGLIVIGHVLSVCVAHRIALRLWPSRYQALLSQLPMLALMITFTIFGLWILAQPLTAMLMR